jgi:hypothetical protein
VTTDGRRVHCFDGVHQLLSGEYGRWHGTWWAATPNGLLADLGNHEVTEHADGTISVLPEVNAHDSAAGHRWRGFLTRGSWREA